MSRFHKTIYSLFIFTLMALVALVVTLAPGTTAKAATQDVTLSTTVLPYLSLSTDNSMVSFGNLTPGTPICSPLNVNASVTTNAANGYTLGVSDGSATNSALVHTDATTHIADYAGTIATPTVWTGTGLGVTLYAADTTKEAKWGTGTTVCDALNKYAGIPSAATTAHTVTGVVTGANTSSWSFKVDVPNTQKTGNYEGIATMTITAVLS